MAPGPDSSDGDQYQLICCRFTAGLLRVYCGFTAGSCRPPASPLISGMIITSIDRTSAWHSRSTNRSSTTWPAITASPRPPLYSEAGEGGHHVGHHGWRDWQNENNCTSGAYSDPAIWLQVAAKLKKGVRDSEISRQAVANLRGASDAAICSQTVAQINMLEGLAK